MSKTNRKEFIQVTSLAAAGLVLSPSTIITLGDNETKIKAIAFDGFPIFDPRPIFKLANEFFPQKGKQFTEIWKAKQFGYQWLRVAANRYKNFWEVTADALDFALEQCELTLSKDKKQQLMEKYTSLNVWPDVKDALQQLKKQDLKLGFLSNMTAQMLNQGIINSGTKRFFEFVISTDEKRTFKPSPKAYQMGIDKLNVNKEEILFVAFAGWDMAGAKWFGYPSYWVNRFNAPLDSLDAEPDGVGSNLNDLVEFVKIYNKI